MLFDLVSELVHQLGANEARNVLPDVGCLRSRSYGIVDVFHTSRLDFGDHLLRTRVDNVKGLATLGVLPLTIDEELVAHRVGGSWNSLGSQSGLTEEALGS